MFWLYKGYLTIVVVALCEAVAVFCYSHPGVMCWNPTLSVAVYLSSLVSALSCLP
jgi:hypothetical protein